ncbi:hypothetical protein LY76DRAFT_257428 [Colletotrichum caudatum]|nr:hypothetical protein LY76DRAFT_257428 [Colletotrichum caudatum]
MSISPLLPSTLTRDGPRPSVSRRHAQLSPRVPPGLFFFSFSVKMEPVDRHSRSSVNSLHHVSCVPVRFLGETTPSDAVTAPITHTLAGPSLVNPSSPLRPEPALFPTLLSRPPHSQLSSYARPGTIRGPVLPCAIRQPKCGHRTAHASPEGGGPSSDRQNPTTSP